MRLPLFLAALALLAATSEALNCIVRNGSDAHISDSNNHILYVSPFGVDANATGASHKPFSTIQAALDHMGAAASSTAFSSEDDSRWIIKLTPHNYIEELTVPTQAEIVFEMAGAKITGDITYAVSGTLLAGTVKASRLIFNGGSMSNMAVGSGIMQTSGIEGDLHFSQSGGTTGKQLYVEFNHAGIDGDLNLAGSTAITMVLWMENVQMVGDIGVSGSSSNHISLNAVDSALDSITGNVRLVGLNNVVLNGICAPTGSANLGAFFLRNVVFLNGIAHDFSGITDTELLLKMDENSMRSYIDDVPTKGSELPTPAGVYVVADATAQAALTTAIGSLDGVAGYEGFPIFQTNRNRAQWVKADGTLVNAFGTVDNGGANIAIDKNLVMSGATGAPLSITASANSVDAINIPTGKVTLTDGSLTLTSGAFTMTSGSATLTAGSLTLTLGGFTMTNGAASITKATGTPLTVVASAGATTAAIAITTGGITQSDGTSTFTGTSTNVPLTVASNAATVAALQVTTGGVKFKSTVSATGSGFVCTASAFQGVCVFDGVINAAAAQQVTFTNTLIASTTRAHLTPSCTTDDTFLVAGDWTPGSGSATFRVINLGGTNTGANIEVAFTLLHI